MRKMKISRINRLAVTVPQTEVPVIREVDVLVLGSGPAGVAAAISAGREGMDTLLAEACGNVGGIATEGLMSHWTGGTEGFGDPYGTFQLQGYADLCEYGAGGGRGSGPLHKKSGRSQGIRGENAAGPPYGAGGNGLNRYLYRFLVTHQDLMCQASGSRP